MNGLDDRQRKTWVSCVVIFAAGLFLFLVNLGGVPLANDEAAYIRPSMEGWETLLAWIASDNYPPLWLVGFKVWLDLVGPSILLLRLSSLPFVVAGWLLLAWWGMRRLPRRVVFFWLLLVVTSPLLLFIHRLAKYFAPLNFLVLLSFLLLWELLEENPKGALLERPWLLGAWCASSQAMLWIHYVGAGCWFAMGCWLLYRGWQGNRKAWQLLAVLCVTFLGFVPHLYELVQKILLRGGEELSHPHLPSARRLVIQGVYTVYSFSIGHTIEASRFYLVIPGVLSALLLLGFGVWCTLRDFALRKDGAREVSSSREGRLGRFCVFVLVVSALYITFNMTVMWFFLGGLPDLHIPERTSAILPFLLLLVAVGFVRAPRRPAMIVGVIYGGIVALSCFNTVTMRESNPWDQLIPWETIRADVERHQPGLVAGDNWHFGSRPWFYFSRDGGWEFIELRWVHRDGDLASKAGLAGQVDGAVALIRSTRDSSLENHVSAFQQLVEEHRGGPDVVYEYVPDSPSMIRLKELLRRGTGQETHQGKVQLVIWQGEVSAADPQE